MAGVMRTGIVRAAVEAVVPGRLGRGFRYLFASAFVMNAGDGVILAAGPLLVASLTRDPFLVSLAFLCEYLPSLAIGTFAGVVVDRVDRKRVVVAVNLGRAAVLAVLAVAVLTGTVSIALVLAALLVLGTAETFGDLAASSMLPRVVPRADIGIANARLTSAFLLTNQLVAPPIGAFLFAAGMALPFIADAMCYVLGAILISRIVLSSTAAPRPVTAPRPATARGGAAAPGASPGGGEPAQAASGRPGMSDQIEAQGEGREPRSARKELVEGFRWLRDHPPMRTLALTIFAFNVTYGAAWSVLVLYAGDRLGMDSVGFGLLTTAMAIGGIVGTSAYGRLERRFSLGDIMRVGLVIETATHLVLALTTSPALALLTMLVFGAHAFVWGTTATTIRQRAVPDELLGRVGGIYRVALNAGIVVGTPVGGLLARDFGITAPFWFGFVGSAILVVVLWRELRHIAHSADEARGPFRGGGGG